MSKIGLIAGNRKFPIIVACEAKKRNYSVIAIAVKGETHSNLNSLAEKVYWLEVNEFPKIFEIFKNEGITDVVLAGQISPVQLFNPRVRNSPELKNLFDSLTDQRADTIFLEIVRRLESSGIKVLDSTFLLKDFMPETGILTAAQPGPDQEQVINLGVRIAKEMGSLDIGQTVAVKDMAIVAIEALEGTDNLIKRAGRITRCGAIIVKMSKPNQDMRFDVPVIGLNTIKHLLRIKAAGLVIEAGKTLFIDREKSLALANKKNVWIKAV